MAEVFVDIKLIEVLFWVLTKWKDFEDAVIHVRNVIQVTFGVLLDLLHFDVRSSEGFFVGDLIGLK